MPIPHQHHQSDDPDWEDYFNQENPDDRKKSPYWRLSEKLNGKYESVGLYNKNTANKKQKDVSIYGQTVQEADWIKEKVQQGHITPTDEKKLGMRSLLNILDKCSLNQFGFFIDGFLSEALLLKRKLKMDLRKLGKDPLNINPKDMETAIKKGLEDNLQVAAEAAEAKIKNFWRSKADEKGGIVTPEGCRAVASEFLGEEFQNEIEILMACKVRHVFASDDTGDMQLSRFDCLRDDYVNQTQKIVAEKFANFSELASRELEFFGFLSKYEVKGEPKSDILFFDIFSSHFSFKFHAKTHLLT